MTCSMQDSEKRQKLLNYAYFYLNIRPRTVKEVRDYLVKKANQFHVPLDVIDDVVDRLVELNLLNDNEFVRWYVEGKSASSKKSTFLLRQEMTRLGITKANIDEYFAGRQVNEIQPARDALASRWRRFRAFSDKKIRFQKAAAYLGRRGFSYDVIKKTIAEYEGEE